MKPAKSSSGPLNYYHPHLSTKKRFGAQTIFFDIELMTHDFAASDAFGKIPSELKFSTHENINRFIRWHFRKFLMAGSSRFAFVMPPKGAPKR